MYSLLIVAVVFVVRLVFLKRSIANEKAILQAGGREYGVQNSKYITLLHIAFYLFCTVEALIKRPAFDAISWLGLVLLVGGMGMLYVVTQLLGPIWTVKLMILDNHQFVDHWLFRTVKHPNYFLNILPELVGLCLLCHAWYTLALLSLPYSYVMYQRIREENRLLREVIIPNSSKKEG